MRRSMTTFACALAFAGMMATVTTTAVTAKELIYGSSLPAKHGVNSAGVAPMLKAISEASKNDLTWKVLLGGQLLTAKAGREGLTNGLADAAYINPTFDRKSMVHNNVLYDATFFGDDPVAVNAANIETIMFNCPRCRAEYKKLKVVFLAEYASSPFRLVCSKPVTKVSDVVGRKIRGTGPAVRWIAAMGGTPITMHPAEAVSALERGAIDCSYSPFAHLLSYGYKDIAKHVVDFPMGVGRGYVHFAMNRMSWDRLSKQQRQHIVDSLPLSTARATLIGYVAQDDKAVKISLQEGVKFVKGGDDFRKLMDDYLPKERQALMKAMKDQGAKNPEEILEAFLKNLSKWQKISREEIKGDVDAYAAALKREIYDRVDVSKY